MVVQSILLHLCFLGVHPISNHMYVLSGVMQCQLSSSGVLPPLTLLMVVMSLNQSLHCICFLHVVLSKIIGSFMLQLSAHSAATNCPVSLYDL